MSAAPAASTWTRGARRPRCPASGRSGLRRWWPPYQKLGMVDVGSFYCVRRLSRFGHGNVTVNLPCGLDSDILINLWSWRLWAYYAGEPYFCGVPTGLQDEDGSAHVQFTLIELPGYLTRRQQDEHPFLRVPAVRSRPPSPAARGARAGRGRGDHHRAGAGQCPRPQVRVSWRAGRRGQLLINLCRGAPGAGVPHRVPDEPGGPASVRSLRIAYPRVGSERPGSACRCPARSCPTAAQLDSDQLRTRTFAVGDLAERRARGRGAAGGDHLDGTTRACPAWTRWTTGRARSSDDAEGAGHDSGARSYSIPAQQVSGSPPESYPDDHDLRAGRHGDRAGGHPADPRAASSSPARLSRSRSTPRPASPPGRSAMHQPAAGHPADHRRAAITRTGPAGHRQAFHSGGIRPAHGLQGGPMTTPSGKLAWGQAANYDASDDRAVITAVTGGPGRAGPAGVRRGRGRAASDHQGRLGRRGELR